MLNRLRRLRISLAAKCQLLFGAAVVLIISAALAVPWHRLEELTSQLNTGPAEALAHEAIRQHVQARLLNDSATSPAPDPRHSATQPPEAPTQSSDPSEDGPR